MVIEVLRLFNQFKEVMLMVSKRVLPRAQQAIEPCLGEDEGLEERLERLGRGLLSFV